MEALERLRAALPEPAKDTKLNLQTVLTGASSLSAAQRWGAALAVAFATRQADVTRALLDAARAQVGPAVIDDAMAAASLMGMNNVYYRFRHIVGNPSYTRMPARLRMQRLVQPAAEKVDFELFALAVSAVNGCEACVQAHEKAVLDGGLGEEQVHDAVRVAAVVSAAAVAADMASVLSDAVAAPAVSAVV